MCEICNGKTIEKIIERDARVIAERGYIVEGVDSGREDTSWAYTVGLVDVAQHPELIVAGVEARFAMALVNHLAQWVLDGNRFHVGDEIELAGEDIATIGAVHAVQHELDTFAMWHRLHAAGVVHEPLQACQVVLPIVMFCASHAHTQPVLADPTTRLGPPGEHANRAARRRGKRSA